MSGFQKNLDLSAERARGSGSGGILALPPSTTKATAAVAPEGGEGGDDEGMASPRTEAAEGRRWRRLDLRTWAWRATQAAAAV